MTLLTEINALCEKRFGRRPNLDNPRGYNDLIQWLKLHDQTPEHVLACDKLTVRQLVTKRIGEGALIPLYFVGERYAPVPPDQFPCVYKASHDSGSAVRVESSADLKLAKEKMRKAMERKHYGIGKGEWAYRLIERPRVMVERALPGPIVDYKFHCSGDQIRWVQIISERGDKRGPAEAIFDPDGRVTDLHLDHQMRHVPDPQVHPGPSAWDRLSSLARELAAGWRYVRVDLYWIPGEGPYFGELTFWPLAGCYRTRDEPTFGDMLKIPLSFKREPIVR